MSIISVTMSQEAYMHLKDDYVNRQFAIKGIPRVFRIKNNHTQKINGYQQVMLRELLRVIENDQCFKDDGFFDLGSVDINMLECGPRLYKYLDEGAAKKNVLNGTIRFKQPSCWQDDFERLYYQADYSRIVPVNVAKYTPRLNACCFTYQPETNAAWSMYRCDWKETRGRVVCFEINEKKLLVELGKYAEKEDCAIYQGYVDYRIHADDLKELYKKDSRYYKIFFEDFSLMNYLSLLLLKRNAFSYEQETRFFVIPNSQDVNDFIDIPIPLNKVVNRIILSPNYNRNQKKTNELIELYRDHGLDCDIVISELSQKAPRNIVIGS